MMDNDELLAKLVEDFRNGRAGPTWQRRVVELLQEQQEEIRLLNEQIADLQSIRKFIRAWIEQQEEVERSNEELKAEIRAKLNIATTEELHEQGDLIANMIWNRG